MASSSKPDAQTTEERETHSLDFCKEGCIGFVGFRIYLGSAQARLPELLRGQGITHVLSIGSEKGKNYVELNKDEFQLRHVHAEDIEGSLMRPGYEEMEVKGFLEEGTSSGNATLVHCAMGRSRSMTIVALFLVEKKGLPVMEALVLLLSARLDLRPQNSFIQELVDLEADLNEHTPGWEESFELSNLPGPLKRHPTSDAVVKLNTEFYKKHMALIGHIEARVGEPVGAPVETELYARHRFKDFYQPQS